MTAVAERASGFARRLRAAGLSVPFDRVIAFTAAIDALAEPASHLAPSDVYWAGRCTLLRTPEDRPSYDRAFAEEFLGHPPIPTVKTHEQTVRVADDRPEGNPAGDQPDDQPGDGSGDEPDHDSGDGAEMEEPDQPVRWSAVEVLAKRDFAEATPCELRELWAAVARLRIDAPAARSRRRRPAATGPLDLRRSVRAALARDGELVELRRRDHGLRPRRVVLIIDVSGSMEPYARALVRFAHAASVGGRRVEVFAVGTRLTRLTRQLATRDPDAALGAAAREVPDWSGGTRLGDAIGSFVDRWGQRGMARGATVVVFSDGWDRGEPVDMAEQMARLSRLAHRIVWVNPLRATTGYAPIARGMAAALPYCDDFVDGHSLASLIDLANLLAAESHKAESHKRAGS